LRHGLHSYAGSRLLRAIPFRFFGGLRDQLGTPHDSAGRRRYKNVNRAK
jgi:hypothetical protein